MTSFVHVDQPTEHPGVARATVLIQRLAAARRHFDGARGLAALLLAAMVSALLVVADRLISTWNDGGLVAAWVALWAIAFVALALLAGSTRSFAARAVAFWRAAEHRRRLAQEDSQLWRIAQTDRRVMADLQAAISRSQDVAPAAIEPAGTVGAIRKSPSAIPTMQEATRRIRVANYY